MSRKSVHSYKPVMRRIEYVMQRDGEFHHAKARAQMTAGARNALDHVGAKFGGQLRQFGIGQPAQIRRRLDRIEQWRFKLHALGLSMPHPRKLAFAVLYLGSPGANLADQGLEIEGGVLSIQRGQIAAKLENALAKHIGLGIIY